MKKIAAEKNFENRVKKWLQDQGVYPFGFPHDKMQVTPCGYYVKRWGGGRFQKDGLPDMQIVICGKCLEVELKAENGKPSELQRRNIDFIEETGGMGFIIYPEHFERLKQIVLYLKNGEGNNSI